LDSFYEPEQPKSAGRRALIFIVLLVALGVAGWWVRGYLAGEESRKSETAAQDSNKSAASTTTTNTQTEAKNETPTTQAPAPETAPATDTKTPQVQAPNAAVPEGPSESASANPNPDVPSDVPQTSATPAAKPTQLPAREIPKNTRSERTVENRKSRPAPAKAEKPPANTGDADFRKGEAYLYGRGARENCAEAVKSLKAASAQSNAKARSAFGTMYATGHCVPRDLPTSYLWFALALRVDPNNQILEKDLNAVWNQMTPPERQTATRMKQ
jgi:TPR repeat protein